MRYQLCEALESVRAAWVEGIGRRSVNESSASTGLPSHDLAYDLMFPVVPNAWDRVAWNKALRESTEYGEG